MAQRSPLSLQHQMKFSEMIIFMSINALRPRQKRHYIADNIFKSIEWKLYYDSNFTKRFPQGSTVSIDLDNGLAPKRQQAIIWTNHGLVYSIFLALTHRHVVKIFTTDKTYHKQDQTYYLQNINKWISISAKFAKNDDYTNTVNHVKSKL